MSDLYQGSTLRIFSATCFLSALQVPQLKGTVLP